MANDEISLPYFIVILVVSALIIRYLFFSGPSASQQPSQSPEARALAREAAAERILQMFPQADRRSILWNLQSSGGSIQATTERILAGRLDTPPVTFQPPPAPARPGASSTAATARTTARPSQPDLITRYNLGQKVGAEEEEEVKKGGRGWSLNKDERQAMLHKRRDEMILAARRKMEAKIQAQKATGKTA